MRINGRHARCIICLVLVAAGIMLPTDRRTGCCLAALPPIGGSVMDMRGSIEECWEAVMAGDPETARKKAIAAQERWDSVPPMVRRVISRRHPNVQEILDNLPAEAEQLANERLGTLSAPGRAASSPPAGEAGNVIPVPRQSSPASAESSPAGPAGGVILLGAAAVPTDEALSSTTATDMVRLTIFHRADRKIVVLPTGSDLDRTFVVEGNDGAVTFTASFPDPGQLLLVNPGNRPLPLQLPGGALVLAPLSHRRITVAGSDHGIRVVEPASSCLLVITTGNPPTTASPDDSGQVVLVAAGEPIHIVMTDPQQQKVVATGPASPSRLLVLYPAYPMAYVAATTPSDYTEVVFVGTAYTRTVSYVTATGAAAVIEVPTESSAVYVIDSPQTIVYQNTAGSVTVARPTGETTITHSGGGVVTTGAVSAGVHAGRTTVTGPAGNSATLSSSSGHAMKTVGETTYGAAAGAATVQTSTGQSVTMGGVAAGSVTVSGNTTVTSSTMGGAVTNDTTGQWAAGTRSGSGSVTRTDNGQVESAQYSGQGTLSTGSGLTATTQTQASADNIGSGSGSVSAQTDVQTGSGKDYTFEASATKGEATVSASNNASGQSASTVIGDQQINNAAPTSVPTGENPTGTTFHSGAAKASRTNALSTGASSSAGTATAGKARSARITESSAAIQQPHFQSGQASGDAGQTATDPRRQALQAGTFANSRTAASNQIQHGQQGHLSNPADGSVQWTQKSQRTYSDEHDMFGNTGFGSSRSNGNGRTGNRSGGGKRQ